MPIIAEARIALRWPSQQQVPLDGSFNVYRDDRDGDVDYETPVNGSEIPAWPDGAGKIGAGLGRDGMGADGFGDGGVGDGLGIAGLGPDGFGAHFLEFPTPLLADGTWELAVVGLDAAANAVTPAVIERQASVAGTPGPPGVPEASNYDSGTDTITLQWALSPDDEG